MCWPNRRASSRPYLWAAGGEIPPADPASDDGSRHADFRPDPMTTQPKEQHTRPSRLPCTKALRSAKVGPLGRALAGAAAWITGLRADQSRNRTSGSFASIERRYQIVKVNPLLDWTRDHLVAYSARSRHIDQPIAWPWLPLDRLRTVHTRCCARRTRARPADGGGNRAAKRSAGFMLTIPLVGPRSSAQLGPTKGSMP